MLKATKVYARVLNIVSEECDMGVERIKGKSRDTESVDARWICVKLLSEMGLYVSRIAEMMSITPRYVQYILTDFEDRIACCNLMRMNYERARKNMRKECERTDF